MKQVITAFVTTLVSFWLVHRQEAVFFSTNTPLSILDLELAKTETRISQLLWNTQLDILKNNIACNYLFIAAYAWLLYTLLANTLVSTNSYFVQATKMFKSILLFITCLVFFENILLFFTVKGLYNNVSLNVTFWLAVSKYAFIAVCLTHIFISFILGLFYGRKR